MPAKRKAVTKRKPPTKKAAPKRKAVTNTAAKVKALPKVKAVTKAKAASLVNRETGIVFLTIKQLREVRNLAQLGLRDELIRTSLGLAPKRWREVLANQDEVSHMLAEGRARDLSYCMVKLNSHIDEKNFEALRFKLKAVHNFRDNTPVIVDQSSKTVQINLPDSVSPEDYRKMFSLPAPSEEEIIEGEATELTNVKRH